MDIREVVDIINNERKREEKLYEYMTKRKEQMPDGSLSVLEKKDDIYYYQNVYVDGERKNIYLDPHIDEHRTIIKELMEKKTLVHGMPILRRNVKSLGRTANILQVYHPNMFQYGDKLGSEYYLEGDVCVKDWLKKPECQNPSYLEHVIHETKRGPKVRSKSEVIISDIVYDHNILYKNETRLWINGRWIYPDLELLHPKTRKLFWWEHLGKLEDPNYVFKNLEKINVDYARSGIEVGKNLILTYETKDMPLTRSMVEERLKFHDFF